MHTSDYKQNYFKDRLWETAPKKIINDVIRELRILSKERLHKDLSELTILDVGSGAGEYSIALSKIAKKVVGVEPFQSAYSTALKRKKKSNSKAVFINDFVENVKTRQKFDLALSLTTLEHMPNANASYKRIFQLLKPNGIIYLTAPNKLWPYENHYKLFFLSWLPRNFANAYVRIMNRGTSYDDSSHSLTYWGIKHLFNQYQYRYDFVLPSNLNSSYLGCGESAMYSKLLRRFGIAMIKTFPIMWVFSKGFILVLQKQKLKA